MPHRSYADELEAAAADIGNRSIPELQILLRRAALIIGNSGTLALDEPAESALAQVIEELGRSRNTVLRTIVTDWLVSYGRLPVPPDDETA